MLVLRILCCSVVMAAGCAFCHSFFIKRKLLLVVKTVTKLTTDNSYLRDLRPLRHLI